MATEFDPRRNIPPPEGTELTAEERVQQRFSEHLRDVELEDTRFKAFGDYVDMVNSNPFLDKEHSIYNGDMVKETIRQRTNGIKGYKAEYDQILGVGDDYWSEIKARYDANLPLGHFKFARELLKIKDNEIDRRNQKYLTSQKK